MSFVTVLLVACVVSFLGSIPPGTINISVMQLAMLQRRSAALAFGLAASLVEFVYAGLTVRFHIFLTENTNITDNFQIITAIAMIILGIANMRSHKKTEDVHTPYEKGLRRHAFRKGLLLGVMNPMTVPFWLAVTAYLETNSWVELNSDNFYGYIAGISIGTFLLLAVVTQLGSKFKQVANNEFVVHKLPGLAFLCMGLWNLYQWWVV
ncbi:MAG: LysE family transporter [bacterium]|nr:LysE family transporter [bacterium]